MPKLYVVKAERYGRYEGGAFIIGVFSKRATAGVWGEWYKQYRGGKYYPNIIEVEVSAFDSYMAIMESWTEGKYGARRNIEFKVLRGGHSPKWDDSFITERKNKIEHYELDPVMDDESMLDCHEFIDFFSNEEKEVLRDLYENYIRRKINS